MTLYKINPLRIQKIPLTIKNNIQYIYIYIYNNKALFVIIKEIVSNSNF